MPIILGSRSPRRRELLGSIVGAESLHVRPPLDSDEQGFAGLHDAESIQERLRQIVQTKLDDVQQQVQADASLATQNTWCVVADTIVVAQDPQAGTVVLGQPDASDWQGQVRDWMLRLYSGGTHEVWTGFQLAGGGKSVMSVVRTVVRFCQITPDMADWYLSTGESVGKAGGYAVQGAAAAFVTAIDGSLTNIIGLPVLEVTHALQSLGCRVPATAGSN